VNATSELRVEQSAAAIGNTALVKSVLVWDAPVRVFHWLMVLCFTGAYLTSESETWRLLHITLGYTMAGLVAFRILWGFVGTRYSRFTSFVRGPKAVATYLRSLLALQPEHHTGHNPAGALAIVGMLVLTAAIATTGWATYNEVAGEWVAELHEVIANGMLMLVGLHIAAVFFSGWLHKENLARAMLTGRKSGAPSQGISSAWRVVAVLLLVAVLGFWYMQWCKC
jgi:cytochrome b